MSAVAPLVADAERVLLDLGWRTRVPRRALLRQHELLSDRRRLRNDSYDEIERATVLVHVPAPARFAGTKPHRELQHAINCGVAIALLVALSDRERLGVGAPSSTRVEELADMTHGMIITGLDQMPSVLEHLAARARRTG